MHSTPASWACGPGRRRRRGPGGLARASSPTTPWWPHPIGPSPFDPEGKGHHGRDAIAAFYDNVIANSEGITFEITESYLCGDEVADVGVIRTTLAGGTHEAVVRGVYTYRPNGAGKLAGSRAFWEFDRLELVELGSLPACAVMVREGLFTDARGTGAARAAGAAACGSHLFPRADACPYCAAEDPEPVELSSRGTLWSWTAVTAPLPGTRASPLRHRRGRAARGRPGHRPAHRELPAALAEGQAMELRIVPLHRDEDGNDVVTYAFAPA